jgi:hypothetical protein
LGVKRYRVDQSTKISPDGREDLRLSAHPWQGRRNTGMLFARLEIGDEEKKNEKEGEKS